MLGRREPDWPARQGSVDTASVGRTRRSKRTRYGERYPGSTAHRRRGLQDGCRNSCLSSRSPRDGFELIALRHTVGTNDPSTMAVTA